MLTELKAALTADRFLTRLPSYLVTAGEKVVYSNAHLAEQLRRLLDEQTQVENRRVQELIQEIKQGAQQVGRSISGDEPFLELEGAPEIQFIMDRDLWEK